VSKIEATPHILTYLQKPKRPGEGTSPKLTSFFRIFFKKPNGRRRQQWMAPFSLPKMPLGHHSYPKLTLKPL
jgi:hypothetical protein